MKPGLTVEEIKRNIEISQGLEAEERRIKEGARVLCEYVGIDYVGP